MNLIIGLCILLRVLSIHIYRKLWSF
jgi:hypothetical protein